VALSDFNGVSPNGTWSLYVYDFMAPDQGAIAGGWSLMIATMSPPTISSIPDQVTPVNTTTPAIPFTIGDAQTAASNLVLTVTSSNPALVPTNNIVFGGSDTNRTITLTPLTDQMGTATITVTVTDGDGLSTNDSFVLTVSPAQLTVTIDSFSRTYGATNPVFTGSIGGLQSGDDIGLSLSTGASPASPLGSYPIVPTFLDPSNRLGNYTVVTNGGTLTVTQASLTVTANSASKTYGDADPALTYQLAGNLYNGDTLSGALSRVAGEAVGSYAILQNTLGAGSNYTITYQGANLRILRRSLLVKAGNASRSYGQTNPVFTVTYAGFVTGDGPSSLSGTLVFTTAATPTSTTGTYSISPSGLSSPNYSINFANGTLTVNQAPVSVSADAVSKVYGDADPSLTYHITSGSLFNGDNFSGALIRVAGQNAGAYAIQQGTLTAGTNYVLTYTGTNLTIQTRALLAQADNKTRSFGTTNPVFTISYSGFAYSDTTNVLQSLPTAGTTATTTSLPGGYAITLSGGSDTNYLFNLVSGILTITSPVAVRITSITQLSPGNIELGGSGDTNVTYTIQTSSDLVNWQSIGTATSGGSGVFQFQDSNATNSTAGFYRTSLP
jgi:hypothetical protein